MSSEILIQIDTYPLSHTLEDVDLRHFENK